MPYLQIDPRFNGPPHSANGGYACGLVAHLARGPVEVSLRLPPPLGRPLRAEVTPDGGVRVHDDGALVVEAVPAPQPHLDLEVPGGVDLEAAQVASRGYAGFDEHPFPTCWTCGPDRHEGDGLRIFTGPVATSAWSQPPGSRTTSSTPATAAWRPPISGRPWTVPPTSVPRVPNRHCSRAFAPTSVHPSGSTSRMSCSAGPLPHPRAASVMGVPPCSTARARCSPCPRRSGSRSQRTR
jgi:hypothetical protein